MTIEKEKVIKYFEKNKWYDESYEESFLIDFSNALQIKNILFESVNEFEFSNSNKLNQIKYYYTKISNVNENNVIFIPLYKQDSMYAGIGYLFGDKVFQQIDKFDIKSFCKFIVSQKELNQMYLIC